MREVVRATTNYTTDVFIQDSSKQTGVGLTGLVYNSAGLACTYWRNGLDVTDIPLVTQTVKGVHADGGFVELDSSKAPGLYRIDLPDLWNTTEPEVTVVLKGAANMAPVFIKIIIREAAIAKEASVSTIGDTALRCEAAVADLDGDVADLAVLIVDLHGDVGAVSSALSAANGALTDLDGDVSALASVVALESTLEDVKEKTDQLLFNEDGELIAQGVATIVVGPIVGRVAPGNFIGEPANLAIFVREKKTFSLTVLDDNEDQVDLSDMTLRLVIETQDQEPSLIIEVDEGDITVSGDNNEVANVVVTADSIDAGNYNWRLWNDDEPTVLMHGQLTVVAATKDEGE